MSPALPRVLLVEPQFVLRRTFAAAARDLGLAEVHEAANLGAAERLAALQSYAAVVLSQEAAPAAAPGALQQLADTAQAARRILLLAPGEAAPDGVTVLRKPVKVKDLLGALAG
ncbi:MAG TPA: response regulator [Ramlibacter sp.]|jgi:CheY-like chemotaxis protein|uniref:response regulator n=1 Tax=Ramlibacter sp. TaxID=1917967 RepID=UPI002D430674|nr:response regulator [Ramlibacter sp.]HZY19944.1 response regulator [Ramlibacter sp.]